MTRARRRRPGHPWAALKGTDPALHELAHYLRGLIDNAGRTLQQLASDVDCSTSTMSKRLNGSMLPEQKFVRAIARVCAPDAASLDKRLTEAGMRWEKAHRNQGHVTATRAADDARAMVIATQQQVIQVHEQLHEANLQLLASERAEQRTTKMIWVLTSLLGHVMRRVQEVTAQRDAAERDLTEIHRRTQDQLDRATAEHERARCLVRAAENKVAVLHGKLRALTAPDDVRSVVDEQAEIDDLNAGLDRMHRLLDEQEEELNRLTEQIGPDRQPFETGGATFEDVAESSLDGIVVTDASGRFVRTNKAFRDMVDHTADKLTELSFFELIHPNDRESLAVQYQNLIDGREHRTLLSTRLLLVDSTVIRVDLVATLLRRSGASSQILTVVEDTTEVRLLQAELSRQALHDVLTGLPNRQFFTTHLEGLLRRAFPQTGVTIYHIQLDAVPLISAGLGQKAGDLLLIAVAERLRAVVADQNAMVARIDSAEFAVVIDNKPDTPDVLTMIGVLNEELSAEPVYIGEHGVSATACIGVVHRPPRDMDPTELLRASAMTLARARSKGFRQWAMFDPDRHRQDVQASILAAQLPGALEMGEIFVTQAPVVDLATNSAVRSELVLQWHHKALGVMPHDQCLELAEQTGFSSTLGSILLTATCRELRATPDIPLSVNLTRQQSADMELVSTALRSLDLNRVSHERLWLGMPLDLLSDESGEAADNLRMLADLGIEFIGLDFTGSLRDLACLERFSLRAVRIAAAFTNTTLRVANLVHQAGALLIVDGIATEEQADWWRHAGADLASGPLWGPHGTQSFRLD